MAQQGILVYKWKDFTINSNDGEYVVTFSKFQESYGKFEAMLYSPTNLDTPIGIWTKDKAVKIFNDNGEDKLVSLNRDPSNYIDD